MSAQWVKKNQKSCDDEDLEIIAEKILNIRQLYFPYREIYESVGEKKEIICLCIHKMNDVIYIWKFKFEDYKCMTSIKCIGYDIYEFYEDTSFESNNDSDDASD